MPENSTPNRIDNVSGEILAECGGGFVPDECLAEIVVALLRARYGIRIAPSVIQGVIARKRREQGR